MLVCNFCLGCNIVIELGDRLKAETPECVKLLFSHVYVRNAVMTLERDGSTVLFTPPY